MVANHFNNNDNANETFKKIEEVSGTATILRRDMTEKIDVDNLTKAFENTDTIV